MYSGSFVDYTEHWHTVITVQLEQLLPCDTKSEILNFEKIHCCKLLYKTYHERKLSFLSYFMILQIAVSFDLYYFIKYSFNLVLFS